MPLSLITGDETYLVEQAVKALRQQALAADDMAALSYHCLNNPKPAALLEALQTVTFNLGGTPPLLEVRDFSWLAKAPLESDKALVPKLKEALGDAAHGKHLLVWGTKQDKRLSFNTQLAKLATHHQHFEVPPFFKPEEAEASLQRTCHTLGINVQRPAAHLLVQSLGNGLQPLVVECQKLHTYSKGQPITEAMVRELTLLNDSVFELARQWLHGPLPAPALHLLHRQLLGEKPARLFSLFSKQLEDAHQLKTWHALGWPYETMAQRLGKKAFWAQKQLEGLAPIGLARLQGLKQRALELELAFKQGALSDTTSLELLVLS
jgi:DNA polymerase III delta subunit